MTTAPPEAHRGVGIAARPAAPRLGQNLSLTDRWRFNTNWEMLRLADGSLFFNNMYGSHRTVEAPSATLVRLLERIERAPSSFGELADGAGGADRIARACQPLVRAGILVPALGESAPAWADEDLVTRFATQLDWHFSLSGHDGQHWESFRRLRDSTVTVLGLGGAGSLLALMLAAAGVGRLRIVDGDVVETPNLVRQILYFPDQSTAVTKADALAGQLRRFSPHTTVEVVNRYLSTPEDLSGAAVGTDFVALCADAPRILINRWIDDACKESGTPYLGSFVGMVGPMYVPGEPGCFRCFEHRMRDNLGERHDLIVEALSRKTSWRYPAFVSGAVSVAQLMATEILLHLSGGARPSTIGGLLKIQYPATTREELDTRPDCTCATDPAGPAR
ncbi:ThiF family adenylyltransferase [Streptomyces sp. NPDC019224]|uniref:ThiF family adenylyltransferase n=1 Tax=Streptomyces sp. NPDC019224 TaxID=3154484 RepID=UPI0033CAB865